VAHDFFRRVPRYGSVVSKQQQTGDEAPERRGDGEVTNDLRQGASAVSGTNTWYGQECHVGGQQHSAL